ncbi:precorrin-2 dehydrogenase/sirohydrochlorin ferrochelatase family protein [Photobacterium indicum]|jgi:precorrin-2 dehydrogenase / sirohydrochlorin ferrochelatase|uniref:precorrin-2 dehydrogenase n=1 Tax=Photobacterium indicum TaxID=81447 RepID=A0A2T3L436_9GAMM|nr:bifunctional precorrin-2 dehydrogenase/sirohydrochlorin ferrochelatase [Photobacterium indicum]PSV44112.1 siroheme synthase [Photobacterium indicum]
MDFFPVFLNLKSKKILVIGGGEVACRKVDLLLKAKADITLVSPKLHPHLSRLVDNKKLNYISREYQSNDVIGFHQVWATTDVRELNHQVFNDANALGIWTNVVDDPNYCNFITPSMIDRTPIQVAVSSGGASPVLVRFIREKLETQLPQNLSLLAAYSGKQRSRIKQYFGTVDERRKFWEAYFRLPAVENAATENDLEAAFTSLLENNTVQTGNLYLIETGDDTEMLSLKALRLMQQSEYVLFPEAKDDIFVDLCRRDAERESYSNETVVNQVQHLLNKDLRVCVLAPKGTHIESLIALNTSFGGQFVPCL